MPRQVTSARTRHGFGHLRGVSLRPPAHAVRMIDDSVLYDLGRIRLEEMRSQAQAAHLANEVRRAAPNFIPRRRWLDTALWAAVLGPLVGGSFLLYFAQEIGRAVQ